VDLSQKIRTLPTEPGVYLYKNAEGEVIYVGKANNLRSRVGSYFHQGRWQDAKTGTLLREAVADLETQVPLNLIELPRALNNLALAEQATSEMLEAEKISTRCLKLYADNKLPDDLIRAETLNLLGTCAALRGDYV